MDIDGISAQPRERKRDDGKLFERFTCERCQVVYHFSESPRSTRSPRCPSCGQLGRPAA